MPQRPVGLDMKLSQPNKLSELKFNFKMGFYFRGGYFPRGFISYQTLSGGFFRGGLFPRPIFIIIGKLFHAEISALVSEFWSLSFCISN